MPTNRVFQIALRGGEVGGKEGGGLGGRGNSHWGWGGGGGGLHKEFFSIF